MIMRPMFKKYNTFGKENEVDRINSKIKRLELTRPKTNYLITNYKVLTQATIKRWQINRGKKDIECTKVRIIADQNSPKVY